MEARQRIAITMALRVLRHRSFSIALRIPRRQRSHTETGCFTRLKLRSRPIPTERPQLIWRTMARESCTHGPILIEDPALRQTAQPRTTTMPWVEPSKHRNRTAVSYRCAMTGYLRPPPSGAALRRLEHRVRSRRELTQRTKQGVIGRERPTR